MRRGLVIWFLLFFSLLAAGQNTPAIRQFYFNPYLFNPAFAGINGYTEVSLLYRQQWLGFNNAPSVSGFTLQYPTQNRASFGMNFLTQEVVALRTTSTQATFAYRVPISANQFIFLGLSAVVGFNDLNLNGADYSNDPAILNAASNTFYGDANFGLAYSLGSLRLGFSFPKLLGQPYFSPQDLVNTRYAQLRNQLYSISYKFPSGNFSFEPYALYRINRDLQNWWETAIVVYFKEKIWTGASYNSAQGIGFFLGANIKEKIRFGYSYEVPLASSEFISTSSHEVQLQWRLGKKRIFKWAARFAVSDQPIVKANTPIKEEPIITQKEESLVINVEPDQKPIITQPKVEERNETVKPVVEKKVEPPIEQKGTADQLTLVPGLYVITGSFQNLDFATAHQKHLIALGYESVKSGVNPKNKLFCVYVFSSNSMQESKKAMGVSRLKTATRTAWILRID